MPITLLSEPLLFCFILLDKMALIAPGRKMCFSDCQTAPAAPRLSVCIHSFANMTQITAACYHSDHF